MQLSNIFLQTQQVQYLSKISISVLQILPILFWIQMLSGIYQLSQDMYMT